MQHRLQPEQQVQPGGVLPSVLPPHSAPQMGIIKKVLEEDRYGAGGGRPGFGGGGGYGGGAWSACGGAGAWSARVLGGACTS